MNKIPEHWFLDLAEFFEFFLQYTSKNLTTFLPDDVRSAPLLTRRF